jgi:Flp pilus assembly protein TadG
MIHPNRRNQRGNSAIEFGIGFSVLFACFSGVFQYGYTLYLYNALQTAVTDGAANFTVNALFSTFQFTNKPAVTMTFMGNYQPAGSGC